jgi:hypothetical protein
MTSAPPLPSPERIFHKVSDYNHATMRIGRTVLAAVASGLTISALVMPPAATAASPTAAIRAKYRTVLTAEYFGPARAVCGNLTAAGVRSFTAAAPSESCTAAYDQLHHILHHKQPDNDNSGYTAKAYRTVVAQFMANLRISVHGTRASVHGPSGLGPSKLVEAGGQWRFSAYPPTVES